MTDGLILGIVSWLSLVMSWWNLPPALKRFTMRHPILADIAGSWTIFLGLSAISKSLVAVIGAAVGGLLINFSIMIGERILDVTKSSSRQS